MPVEVAVLHVSEAVAEKVEQKHGLSVADVKLQVEGVGNLPCVFVDDPEHDLSAEVITAIGDVAVLVAMYQAHSGDPREWWLGTAYPI